MKKAQFLTELQKRLSDLPYADAKRSLDYFSEMIEDRMEDGLSEEEAIKKIGTPAEAAEQIFSELPITTLALARMGRKHSTLAIVLIILGSPIWISLLAAAFSIVVALFAVLFSLLAVIFSLFISLWAIEGSLAAGTLASLIACPLAIFLQGQTLLGIFLLGGALVLCALSIFGYYGAIYGSKGLLFLSACVCKLYPLILRFIKFCLVRKEAIR